MVATSTEKYWFVVDKRSTFAGGQLGIRYSVHRDILNLNLDEQNKIKKHPKITVIVLSEHAKSLSLIQLIEKYEAGFDINIPIKEKKNRELEYINTAIWDNPWV